MSQADRSFTKTLTGVSAAAASIFLVGAAYAAPIEPAGIWYTKDQESIIRVQPCTIKPENFCGLIVWLKEPNESNGSPKLDTLNKDPAKKNKPMIGLEILQNMTADDDHWTGKAYNPEDGKLYSITFTVKTDKEANDSADLRGCLFSVLCRTETFTRAKEVPGGEPDLAQASTGGKKAHKKKDSAHR